MRNKKNQLPLAFQSVGICAQYALSLFGVIISVIFLFVPVLGQIVILYTIEDKLFQDYGLRPNEDEIFGAKTLGFFFVTLLQIALLTLILRRF